MDEELTPEAIYTWLRTTDHALTALAGKVYSIYHLLGLVERPEMVEAVREFVAEFNLGVDVTDAENPFEVDDLTPEMFEEKL